MSSHTKSTTATAITTAPLSNGNKTKRNTARFTEGCDDARSNHGIKSVEAVQLPTHKLASMSHRLSTTLINTSFIPDMISLFGPTLPSLTSRTFWTTQILLELDFFLWRPEFLGREPTDAEMEWVADECVEVMWGRICEGVRVSKGKLGENKDKEEEEDKGDEAGCARQLRRGKRTRMSRREARSLEECLEDMGFLDGNEKEEEDIGDMKGRDVQREVQRYNCIEVRRGGAVKGVIGRREFTPEQDKKQSAYLGWGASYMLGSMREVDEQKTQVEVQAKVRIRPGNAGCLLKKTLR